MSASPVSKPGTAPRGQIVIRTIAMPADTNGNGDVFGGWLVSQMDLGGAVLARAIARSRVVTVAIDAMSFVAPVNVSDTVTCFAELRAIGRTSMKVALEAWAQHYSGDAEQCVTRGLFTYVAIDDHGQPRPVRREDNEPALHLPADVPPDAQPESVRKQVTRRRGDGTARSATSTRGGTPQRRRR